MKTLITAIRRALALFTMRSLEIQLHDQINALTHINDPQRRSDQWQSIYATRAELAAARGHYISLLKPGNCPTWRLA